MTNVERMANAFRDSNIMADIDQYMDLPVVSVSIEWGDWKHDHLRADWIASNAGFSKIGEKLTEDDGSDCFSSIHYYTYTGEEEQ